MDVPRLILICCEGKTEQKYFEIIADVFRGPYFMDIEVHGEKGQHKALIDFTAETKSQKLNNGTLSSEEIVAWAVCDDDGMSFSYNELQKYAKDRQVRLAFARPQFEAYLVQHFTQSKECSKQALYSSLTNERKQQGFEGKYNDGTKADLLWLERAIRCKPKIVNTAITNSETLRHQPYFLPYKG